MNKCASCGFEFEGNFCPNCGNKYEPPVQPEERICANCGAVLGAGNFCENCGTRYGSAPEAAEAAAAAVAADASETANAVAAPADTAAADTAADVSAAGAEEAPVAETAGVEEVPVKEKKGSGRAVKIIAALALLIALIFAGTKLFGGPDEPDVPEKVEVEYIAFEEDKYTVGAGKQLPTSLEILPSNAEDKSVVYDTADHSVAIVDENGVLTGNKEGTTTVTAKAANGRTATATVQVTGTTWIMMPVEYYSWNKVPAGKDYSDGWLCKPILDESIKDWTVTFATGDSNVAKVDKNGNLVCYHLGSTELTATATDGNTSYSATIPVYVNGYELDITGSDQSHEGAGHSSTPVYFYGCTSETGAGKNVITYRGTVTKYYMGTVKKYSVDDDDAPVLEVVSATEYFENAGKGRVRLRSKADTITDTKKLTVTLSAVDSEGLATMGKSTSFDCTVEPNDFTAVSGGTNVGELMYMFQDEFNVFVVQNKTSSTVNFNMQVADVYLSVPSRTDEVDPISCSGKTVKFTPKKASGTPLETDVVAYTAGGQKVKMHILLVDYGSPLTFVSGNTITLEYGEVFGVGVKVDQSIASKYGGVKVTYESKDPTVVSVESNGKVTYKKPGETSITITAKYGDRTENKTYKVYCNGYYLVLKMDDKRYVYAGSGGVPCALSLYKYVDGNPNFVSDVTKSEYMHTSGNGILMLKNGAIYFDADNNKTIATGEKCYEITVFFEMTAPSGEKISTDNRRVNVEPTLDRLSCGSYNIGYGSPGIFYVHEPGEVMLKGPWDLAEVKATNGQQFVTGFQLLKNSFYFTPTSAFLSNKLNQIEFKITTAGGQTAFAVFAPKQ